MPEQPTTELDKPEESELSTSEATVGPEPSSEERSAVNAKEATAEAPRVDADRPAGESEALPARFPFFSLTVMSVLAALMIARAELSRLSGDLIDKTGRSWAFDELTGVAAVTVKDGWSASYAADILSYRQGLVEPFWILGVIAAVLFATAATCYVLTRGAGRRTGNLFWVPILGGVLGVAESVAVRIATHHPPRHDFVASALTWLASARWLALLGTVVVLAWLLLTPPGRSWRQTLKVWRQAIRKHRLSILPVAVVGLVTLTPAAEILDQVPDVVRRWADNLSTLSESLWAVLSLLVFCAALYMLGRARLKLAVRNYPEPRPLNELPDAKPTFWLWGPVLIFVLGVVDRLFGGAVAWGRLLVVCALPVVICLATMAVGWLERRREKSGKPSLLPPIKLKPVKWEVLRAIVVLGDVLAFALLNIAALGAVRAFTAVIAVQAHEVSLHTGRLNGSAVGLLVIGALGALAIWPLAGYLVSQLPVPLDLYGTGRIVPLATSPASPAEHVEPPPAEQAAPSSQRATPSAKPGSKVNPTAKTLPSSCFNHGSFWASASPG
jgi:hypothetical protein